MTAGAIHFEAAPVKPAAPAKPAKAAKPVKRKTKTDPKLVSAARELRDRWLERVNDDPAAITGRGKYEVSRSLAARESPLTMLAA